MRFRPYARPISETFQMLTLAYAVGTVLVVRLFLASTGYPQVGNGTLHIAHLLWGGLLMLVSADIMLIFYGKGARRVAAIGLGIGFGLFIDEVGKFVTRDNNYFFRPAAAIIYVTFVMLFLAVYYTGRKRPMSDRGLMFLAMEELEEVLRGDFETSEKTTVLKALDRVTASQSPFSPLAVQLRQVVDCQQPIPDSQPNLISRLFTLMRHQIINQPGYRKWLTRAITVATLVALGVTIFQALGVLATVFGPSLLPNNQVVSRLIISESEWTATLLQTFWSAVAGVFYLRGLVHLRHDTLSGLHRISRGCLISIVFVEVFTFYFNQFAAVFNVSGYLLFLTVVNLLQTGSPADRGATPAGRAVGAEAEMAETLIISN